MVKKKLGSLKYQFNQRLKELERFGQSKHEAKHRYREACEKHNKKWNPAQADGIFSHNTMKSYKQTGHEFGHWLKENTDIRDLNKVTREHGIAYLQYRQSQGKSAYTVSKDMSAINKIFNFNITKKEAGLRERSYKQATRSRVEREHDRKYNPKNYEAQITVSKAFGLRRESIYGGQYQLKEKSLFRNPHDGKIYASVIEKGGRYREAPCLSSMQPIIEKMYPNIQEREPISVKNKQQFIEIYKQGGDYLFDKYTTKIDNHAFRHEYARNLYQEIYERRQEEIQQGIRSEEEVKLYRGFDESILREVSQALGHNRVSVVVEHYLR